MTLDSNQKTVGVYGLKTIITEPNTSGLAIGKDVILSAGKKYLLLGDLKNGNASTGICLELANYVSAPFVLDTTKFQTSYIKLSPQIDYNNNLQLRVTGSAGQYAFADAIRLYEITDSVFE
ncbi:hypothetical protein D478_27671, partial [Brevibacillus agri BAB-2500]